MLRCLTFEREMKCVLSTHTQCEEGALQGGEERLVEEELDMARRNERDLLG